jgi:hypothetical protein
LFIGHYRVSLAAKRVDAHLSSGRLMLAGRELPGILRGDDRGGILVGSEAHGIVPITTLTDSSEEAPMEKATWRRSPYSTLSSGG